MSESKKTGRFAWYELFTTDTDAAIAFYTKVVGWKTQPFDASEKPYTMWVAGERPVGGVMLLPEEAKKMGAPPHWMAHVFVDDVDASAAKATSLGATIYVPPMDIPTVGRFSVIGDPTGGVMSLFKSAADMAPTAGEQDGEFSWNELISTDPDKSWAFYSEMFGWTKGDAMDMGPMGTYQLFGIGDKRLGGYMKPPPGWQGPSAWLYYVNVAKLSSAIEVVKTSGGKIMNGPQEVPGGGWTAQGMDPQGAMFALFAKEA